MHAEGQGALSYECQAQYTETIVLLQVLDHRPSHQAVLAERAFLQALGGGCQMPIGAAGTTAGDCLALRGAVLDPEGKRRIEAELTGSADIAEELGRRLATMLRSRGAGTLLEERI